MTIADMKVRIDRLSTLWCNLQRDGGAANKDLGALSPSEARDYAKHLDEAACGLEAARTTLVRARDRAMAQAGNEMSKKP